MLETAATLETTERCKLTYLVALASDCPVHSPAGSLPYFRKWDSCRTMPLLGDFSRGSPVTLYLHSGAASLSPHFTRVGSQDRVVKSRPNLSTRSTQFILASHHPRGSELAILQYHDALTTGSETFHITLVSPLKQNAQDNRYAETTYHDVRLPEVPFSYAHVGIFIDTCQYFMMLRLALAVFRRTRVVKFQSPREERRSHTAIPPTTADYGDWCYAAIGGGPARMSHDAFYLLTACENAGYCKHKPSGSSSGSDGVVVKLLVSHLSRTGSIPVGSLPDIRVWESDEAPGRRFFIFSGIYRFHRPFILALLTLKTSTSTAAEISPLYSRRLPFRCSLLSARYSIARNPATHQLQLHSTHGPEACRNIYRVGPTIWKVQRTPSRAERTRAPGSSEWLLQRLCVGLLSITDTLPSSLVLPTLSYNYSPSSSLTRDAKPTSVARTSDTLHPLSPPYPSTARAALSWLRSSNAFGTKARWRQLISCVHIGRTLPTGLFPPALLRTSPTPRCQPPPTTPPLQGPGDQSSVCPRFSIVAMIQDGDNCLLACTSGSGTPSHLTPQSWSEFRGTYPEVKNPDLPSLPYSRSCLCAKSEFFSKNKAMHPSPITLFRNPHRAPLSIPARFHTSNNFPFMQSDACRCRLYNRTSMENFPLSLCHLLHHQTSLHDARCPGYSSQSLNIVLCDLGRLFFPLQSLCVLLINGSDDLVSGFLIPLEEEEFTFTLQPVMALLSPSTRVTTAPSATVSTSFKFAALSATVPMSTRVSTAPSASASTSSKFAAPSATVSMSKRVSTTESATVSTSFKFPAPSATVLPPTEFGALDLRRRKTEKGGGGDGCSAAYIEEYHQHIRSVMHIALQSLGNVTSCPPRGLGAYTSPEKQTMRYVRRITGAAVVLASQGRIWFDS
ncbi:hypothetical protein PR048_000887 [Dryococelus australis]|uniref:Uncharacterized protein n=1 Tax=Dryococelus australis TaxID=614101 RepID=A0ABQ9IGS0_9NEOP|nr:hypothetical protein PR048_000887 [Dryococelus australis]